MAAALDLPPAKVTQLREVSIRPASLDAPVGDDDATLFGELVGDEAALTPFEFLRDQMMREEVRHLIKELDEREETILVMRFGLDGKKPKTLEDVGKRFKVTRERVRQIQNLALTKLRRIMDERDQPPSPPPETPTG